MGKNLTKEQQQLIFVILVVVGGGLYVYWNYLLKPTNMKIAKYENEYKDLVSKIQRAEKQAKRLPALKNQLEKLRVELADLEKQLPTDKGFPNIIRTITREALRENLVFKKVAPSPPKQTQYFEIISLDLGLSGSIHSFVRFLSAIGQQDRIFKAGNLKLSPSGGTAIDGSKSVDISIKLETYAYKG